MLTKLRANRAAERREEHERCGRARAQARPPATKKRRGNPLSNRLSACRASEHNSAQHTRKTQNLHARSLFSVRYLRQCPHRIHRSFSNTVPGGKGRASASVSKSAAENTAQRKATNALLAGARATRAKDGRISSDPPRPRTKQKNLVYTPTHSDHSLSFRLSLSLSFLTHTNKHTQSEKERRERERARQKGDSDRGEQNASQSADHSHRGRYKGALAVTFLNLFPFLFLQCGPLVAVRIWAFIGQLCFITVSSDLSCLARALRASLSFACRLRAAGWASGLPTSRTGTTLTVRRASGCRYNV